VNAYSCKFGSLPLKTHMLSEALAEWAASNSLEAFSRRVDLAVEAVPHVAFHVADNKLAVLREELQALCADTGLVRQCAVAKAKAQTDAELQKQEALDALQETKEVKKAAALNVERSQVAKLSVERLIEDNARQIEQLESQLKTMQEHQTRAHKESDELTALIDEEQEKVDSATAEEKLLVARIESAATDMLQVDHSVSEHASRVKKAQDGLITLRQAMKKQMHEFEFQFLTWTPDDVAAWLRWLDDGQFAAYSKKFQVDGVTGKMLPILRPEELATLGMCDTCLRHQLLEAIGKLRLRVVTERSVAEEPPAEFVCPITRECVETPVAIAGDEQGQAYERDAIERWFAAGNHTVPATGVHLPSATDLQLLPLRALARQAREWRRIHS